MLVSNSTNAPSSGFSCPTFSAIATAVSMSSSSEIYNSNWKLANLRSDFSALYFLR